MPFFSNIYNALHFLTTTQALIFFYPEIQAFQQSSCWVCNLFEYFFHQVYFEHFSILQLGTILFFAVMIIFGINSILHPSHSWYWKVLLSFILYSLFFQSNRFCYCTPQLFFIFYCRTQAQTFSQLFFSFALNKLMIIISLFHNQIKLLPYYRIINNMAFVFRSQKSSPFSITQSPSQLQIPDKDERIHHKCDHQYRKLLIQKKINHEHLKPTCSISPSISDGHRIYQPLKNDEKKKFLFNIRDVRKYKREYKLNQPQQNSKKDPEQFYDLPGSFSPKTMVKYVKSSPQKQNKIANPGPGTYNSQTQTSVQTPVFIKNSQSKILTRPSTNSDEEEAKNQNFFAVKYNCMTSSIFKKSPNLLKRSNKFLLNKIFHHQTPSLNNQIYQMIKDQYEQLNEKKPGPTAYHSRQPSLNQHACKFNQAQRFINSNTSEGPPKYYNLSPNKEQNFNKTSCFSSLVQRFEHKKQDLISLQYTDYEKPFIKQSKNVHKICFNSKIPRSEQMPIDNRPFYSVDNHKKDLLAKFCSNKCQRIPYYINIQPTPSPFSYNICSQWSTQNGFSIPKWQKTKVQNCCGAQNKGSLGISFYLCSQIQLNKKSNNQGSKSQKKRKELDKKAQKPKNKQKENDKYYDIPAEWQKKSFNRYFANDILPANNPIQFRI